jgi:hypothetical protein
MVIDLPELNLMKNRILSKLEGKSKNIFLTNI